MSTAIADSSIRKLVLDAGFEPEAYIQSHADLRQALRGHDAALDHFLKHGFRERRTVHWRWSPMLIPTILTALGDANNLGQLASGIWQCLMLDSDEALSYLWHCGPGVLVERFIAHDIRPYVLIGDSHANLYVRSRGGDQQVAAINLLCSGGTAKGLKNPRSKSQYGQRILNWASGTASETCRAHNLPLFLKFGQVDVEFAYVFDRIRRGQRESSFADFEAFAIESVTAYFAFIEHLSSLVPERFMRICSIFPPVLSDRAWAHGYVNAHIGFLEEHNDLLRLAGAVRELEIPDLRTRTDMHAFFNSELQKACARRHLLYVDDFWTMISSEGTVAPEYIRGHSGENHHLDGGPLEPIISRLLSTFVPQPP